MHDTPTMQVTPPCNLCGQKDHVKNMFPTLPYLRNFLNTHVSVTHSPQAKTRGTSNPSTPKSKSLCTIRHVLFVLYMGTTHHFFDLPIFRNALETICITQMMEEPIDSPLTRVASIKMVAIGEVVITDFTTHG